MQNNITFHRIFRWSTLWILLYFLGIVLILCLGNGQPVQELRTPGQSAEEIILKGNAQRNLYESNAFFRISDFESLGYRIQVKNPADTPARLSLGWHVYDEDFQLITASRFNQIERECGTVIFNAKFPRRTGSLFIVSNNIEQWKTVKGRKNLILEKDIPSNFPDEPLHKFFTIYDVKVVNEKVVEVFVTANTEPASIPSGMKVAWSAIGGNRILSPLCVLPPESETTCTSRILRDRSVKGEYVNERWPLGAVYVRPVVWSQSPDVEIQNCRLL